MKRRNIKDWIFENMPPGEWVTIAWAEKAVRENFKRCGVSALRTRGLDRAF